MIDYVRVIHFLIIVVVIVTGRPRSGVVYNFSRVCPSVRLSVCLSVRR